jgi:hypothetical protein
VVQLRQFVPYHEELVSSYAQIVAVSTDPWRENAALKRGLGANFPFLSDADRVAQRELGLVEITSRGQADLPRDYVLYPDLTIYKVYNGYYYVGRITVEDLRQDFRVIGSQIRADWDPSALDEQQLMVAYKQFAGFDAHGPHPNDPPGRSPMGAPNRRPPNGS